MSRRISVIIPNYNGAKTIGHCLDAVYSSRYPDYEVIVVDDGSTDTSLEIIRKYPCKLITPGVHGGASKSRNIGAGNCTGEILFFIDADCVVFDDTLERVDRCYADENTIIGGSYTPRAYDSSFFSDFQSVFVHYCETKRPDPDYIATHALVIDARLFRRSGGFPEDFLPILEDVEFSHRLRREGCRLMLCRDLLVRHIFNFTPVTSIRNALRKSFFWTMYSLRNRDVLADSGTASIGLKMNVLSLFLILVVCLASLLTGTGLPLAAAPAAFFASAVVNRGLFLAFLKTKGPVFAVLAVLYYSTAYAAAVGCGALSGALSSILKPRQLEGSA